MINVITISGDPASGKGTLSKLLIEKFSKEGKKIELIKAGEVMRAIANEHNMKVGEYYASLSEAERKDVDAKIEEYVKFAMEKASKLEDVVVIVDSRVAWMNAPKGKTFNVRLTVSNEKVAGERVYNDAKRGGEDKYSSIEEAIKQTAKRTISEREGYKKNYGVDITLPNPYDVIIDTTYIDKDEMLEVSNIVSRCFEAKNEKKTFTQFWTSPKTLLPTQSIIKTINACSESGYSIYDFKKLVKKNGMNLNKPIEVVEVDGVKFISDGHHRNFSGAKLVPYVIIGRDDEPYITGGSTCREFVTAIQAGTIEFSSRVLYNYDHDFFGEDFEYTSIYPGIYLDNIFNIEITQDTVDGR